MKFPLPSILVHVTHRSIWGEAPHQREVCGHHTKYVYCDKVQLFGELVSSLLGFVCQTDRSCGKLLESNLPKEGWVSHHTSNKLAREGLRSLASYCTDKSRSCVHRDEANKLCGADDSHFNSHSHCCRKIIQCFAPLLKDSIDRSAVKKLRNSCSSGEHILVSIPIVLLIEVVVIITVVTVSTSTVVQVFSHTTTTASVIDLCVKYFLFLCQV
mmetsp:Transcript_11641/g.13837  ORF Transcript_11641/g.13837 Transcript_11641/m.13837 type:complete len:213 (+) Transcript_11641:744-1382(+)